MENERRCRCRTGSEGSEVREKHREVRDSCGEIDHGDDREFDARDLRKVGRSMIVLAVDVMIIKRYQETGNSENILKRSRTDENREKILARDFAAVDSGGCPQSRLVRLPVASND